MIEIPERVGGWMHPDFYELLDYLGPDFELTYCNGGEEKADTERAKYSSDEDFVKATHIFAYQNLGLSVEGIHRPFVARVLQLTSNQRGPDDFGTQGLTLIDYGAGGGQDGLAFHTMGYKVSFADIYGNSLRWLLWRLRRRNLNLPVYVINDRDTEIPHHNVAWCMDVLEHLSPDMQIYTLDKLAEIADAVFVNLIPGDGSEHPGMHFALDLEWITAYVAKKWPGRFEDFYPDKDGKPRHRLLMYGKAFGPNPSKP